MSAVVLIVNNFLQGWDSGCPTPLLSIGPMKMNHYLRLATAAPWRHDNCHNAFVDFQRVATIVTLKNRGGRGDQRSA
jgi:hypothetical protein